MTTELYLFKSYCHYSRTYNSKRQKTRMLPPANKSQAEYTKWISKFSLDPWEAFLPPADFIEHPCALDYVGKDKILIVGQNWKAPAETTMHKGTVINLLDKSTEVAVLVEPGNYCFLNAFVRKGRIIFSSENNAIFWLPLDGLTSQKVKEVEGAPPITSNQDLSSSQMMVADDDHFYYVTSNRELCVFDIKTLKECEQFREKYAQVLDICLKEHLLYLITPTHIHVLRTAPSRKTGAFGAQVASLGIEADESKNSRIAASFNFLYTITPKKLEVFRLLKRGTKIMPHAELERGPLTEEESPNTVISNLEAFTVHKCELLFVYFRTKKFSLFAVAHKKIHLVINESWPHGSSSRILGAKFLEPLQSVVVYGESGLFRALKIKWANK